MASSSASASASPSPKRASRLRLRAGKRSSESRGWPSNTDVWPANSPNAVATLEQEQDYYNLLDAQCAWFKAQGVGWFAHIFDDSTLPGWGLLTGDGQDKLTFCALLLPFAASPSSRPLHRAFDVLLVVGRVKGHCTKRDQCIGCAVSMTACSSA